MLNHRTGGFSQRVFASAMVLLWLLLCGLATDVSAQVTFSEAQIVDPNAPDMLGFTVADFDEDGDQDLLALAVGRILWFKNDGTGQFVPAEVLKTQVPAQVNGISTADLDNDGDLDVLVGNTESFALAAQSDSRLFWLPNENGQLNALYQISSQGQGVFRTVDFDNDGDLDVVQGGMAVTLYENTGQSGENRFQFGRLLAPGPAGALAIGDFDADGDQDLVATHRGFNRFSDAVIYYEQQADGQLRFNQYTELVSSLRSSEYVEYARYVNEVVSADMDGDEQPEVVISGYINDDVPPHDDFIYMYDQLAMPREVEFVKYDPASYNGGALAVAVADLDGDGDGDVAVVHAENTTISMRWYENPRPEGASWIPHLIANGEYGTALAAADLNSDGTVDLVARYRSEAGREHLYWFENLGGSATNTDAPNSLPQSFEVRSVWPNPSSGTVTLAYQLDKPATVRLEVFDVLGRSVATLVEATRPAGVHEAVFEVQNLPSGTYFYRLEADGRVRTGPVSVVK